MVEGVIFDIKKYAIHDGPGIRTTVFFKGCPLACRWCHNPEGLEIASERLYRQERCIGCGECVAICPQKVMTRTDDGVIMELANCIQCRTCADNCPSGALEFVGKTVTVDDVIKQIEKDVAFYDTSSGGVTFSGGEPLMQPEFLLELLKACGKLDLHRTVDTTGYTDAKLLLKVAEHTELFLYDLKHMNAEKHRSYTGVSNERILDNLELLTRQGAKILIRIPILPGINADKENIDRTAQFVSYLSGVSCVSILPYHDSARGKYSRLGLECTPPGIQIPTEVQLESIAERLKKFGLQVQIGG
jgi:pyruvate formate lyase activating enzyme